MNNSSGLSPISKHGKLQVNGNRIEDSSGKVIQIRGMSLYWSQWKEKYWNEDVIRWLIKDWNISVIRLAIAVENGGYLLNPDTETKKVRTAIEAAQKLGIYIIVDWHDHNAQNHPGAAKKFFKEISSSYYDMPNIIYEIFNEPIKQDWSTEIKPYAQEITETIRSSGSSNLIVAGTPRWSQDVDIAVQDPLNDFNTAYTLHFYASSHKEWLRQKAQKALDKNFALFVTEWGACEANGDGYLDKNETAEWLSFMDKNSLSWCNWSISDMPETSAALKPGADRKGNWQLSDLSESGLLLRKVLRDYN